jgi:threonine dehydratase
MTSRTLNGLLDADVYLKCESFQRIGAFKARGAFNALKQLTNEERKLGVITHSSGNHAQALALASTTLGINSTIVMPENAPNIKKIATKQYGARIVECGNNTADRVSKTEELIESNGFTLIHPYNDMNVIHGAGTAAFELLKKIVNIDIILTPIGGGGLISGTSLAVNEVSPSTRVFGTEPKNADDAYRSFKDGTKIYPSISPNTIADGLRTSLGNITFGIIKENVEDIVTVSENEILGAMKFIWERMKLIVEPSGAVPLAGLLRIKRENLFDLNGLKVGIIISGGNIDLSEFFSLLEKKI